LYRPSAPIARNQERTTQQLRCNPAILPRRLHCDRYLTQDWQATVNYLQLCRTA